VAFVSVIIPVFNREAYLPEAIESVLKQTRPADEILVLDDGSTDRSAEVARSYGERLRCVSQANQGIGGARNAGIALTKGDLVAILDSDDLWTENKLERQCAAFEARPELDMVFCRMKQFFSPEVGASERRSFYEEEMPACFASGMLARRKILDEIGPFDTNLRVGEFISWFGRAQEKGIRSEIVPEVLVHRRVHPGNSVRDRKVKVDYLHVLKRQLDRRRAAAETKT
jgi:glycosyltransferase involved in cell wall biosynthesis